MYRYFGVNDIRPSGWLKRQLEIEMDGLGGNLDKVWPDVRESVWIGGDREGWERVPYWLDGFIPLAYYLDNEDAKARAVKYIDAIIARQAKDGWICPCAADKRVEYDLWAYLLIGKVLAQYCEFTDDGKVFDALYRAMRCLYRNLRNKKVSLFKWGAYRYYEGIIPLSYLYSKRPESWMKSLARILCRQGEDCWDKRETWKKPLFKWTLYTHIVNICMTLKEEAVIGDFLGLKMRGKAEKMWRMLDRYNGTAVGTFTGDECLSGVANNQGTELCSVAELMYSCEVIYSVTGDPVWADRLEKAAFNALPAAISDDMWTHQYDQQVNQIACVRFPGKSVFRTNNGEANMFGLEPHFGCCTANHVQAWPKLVSSIYRQEDEGVGIVMMLPSSLETKVNGKPVRIEIDTEYPFRMKSRITVVSEKKNRFTLKLRVPAWAEGVTVDGKVCDGPFMCIERTWDGMDTVDVEFSASPKMVDRPYGMHVVEYGPLVFSLPIETEYKMYEYVRKDVERKFPYCDYELYPKSEWRYGFAGAPLKVRNKKGGRYPFGSGMPRVTIETEVSRVNWDTADGFDCVAAKTPRSRNAVSDPEKAVLIPYGCAKLRMTEMPLVTKKSR